jgi:hypothetical protein
MAYQGAIFDVDGDAAVKHYRDLNGQHLSILGQGEVHKETIDLQVDTCDDVD